MPSTIVAYLLKSSLATSPPESSYVHPDLLQDGRNVVARTHDVADFQIMRHLHVDDAHALPGGLIVIKAAQIFARDQGVSFAVLLASSRFENGTDCRSALPSSPEGKTLKWKSCFSPRVSIHVELCRFRAPPRRQLQPQHALDISHEIARHAHRDG